MDEKSERTLNGSRDGEEKPASKAKAGDLLPSKVLFVASWNTSRRLLLHVQLDLVFVLFLQSSRWECEVEEPHNHASQISHTQDIPVGVCVTRHTPAPASQALTMYIHVLCTMSQYEGTLLQVSMRLRSHVIKYQIYKRPQRVTNAKSSTHEYCSVNGTVSQASLGLYGMQILVALAHGADTSA
jgi:hypothetical protein